MLLVTTAGCHHTCVRPWARGFQSLPLCWISWRPLGRGIYSLDHHQIQQWVRNQITENNRGCCISAAKQPTINYSVKTKRGHLPGEVAGLQLWEVGEPGIQPQHTGSHPGLCYSFHAATIWFLLCVWPNADTRKMERKQKTTTENNLRADRNIWWWET